MVDRPVRSGWNSADTPVHSRRNGAGKIIECSADGLMKYGIINRGGMTRPFGYRKFRGDGRGQRAAGSVRVRRANARMVKELAQTSGGYEDVDYVAGRGMTTFEQHRVGTAAHELQGLILHCLHGLGRRNIIAQQERGLWKVWRDQVGYGQEITSDRIDGIDIEEPMAGCRDHHGVYRVKAEVRGTALIDNQLHELA